jgi:very-short-patch-repair endonuclease
MPHGFTVDGGLRFAPAARAVADTARGLSVVSEARAVVASAVQQRKCTIQELGVELADGPIRDSARLRAVLLEVMAGVRSAPEAELRDLIRKSGLPLPLFNPQLFLNGEFLATPDAWWPDAGVIAEVDSREWHLSPADWENTMRRHARLSAAGIIVLHISPRQLHTEPDRVVRDIAGALRAGRPVPGIATRLAAA